jgi:UDP-2,3-diacylglucosamine pyrophosphatase LpxH
MPRGLVLSDLHLFAERSIASAILDDLVVIAARLDHLVLNGDIVDFRWTTLGTIDETIDRIDEWLRALAGACPDCHIHYVLGNHDALIPFAQRLSAIAADLDNFAWYPAALRLGRCLFVHGDLLLEHPPQRAFERQLKPVERVLPWLLHPLYRLALVTPLPVLIARMPRPQTIATRILVRLARGPRALCAGVEEVYFGHTHAPFDNFRRGGVNFHNTGSQIRGMRFNPLLFTC